MKGLSWAECTVLHVEAKGIVVQFEKEGEKPKGTLIDFCDIMLAADESPFKEGRD